MYIELFFIIGLHLSIFTKLIYFPYPEIFLFPYLANNGILPYTQNMDQHFPGLLSLPINFAKLGLVDVDSARIWSMGIILILHLLIFFITKRILKSGQKALLANFLFLIWQLFFEGWVLWIDNFLPLFYLPAFYFMLKFLENTRKLKYVYLSGLFLGVALIFKQVVVILILLILIFVYWKTRNFKAVGYFLLGFLPPVFLLLLYFYQIGVFKDFWYWTVVYNLTTFAEYGRKAPTLVGLIRVGFVLAPLTGMLFLKDKRAALLTAIFVIGALAAIFARFDFVHFQPALPFVLIGTTLVANELWKHKKVRYLTMVYFLIAGWWLFIFYKGHLSSKVFFFDQDTLTIASKIRSYTKPQDKIFLFGVVPHLYQLSDTLPAGNVFIMPFPWFYRIAEDKILDGIKRDQPKIIVSDRTVIIEGQKVIDFASAIDHYIERNYHQVDQVGNTKILMRNGL